MAGSELPVVLINVMRGGPGLGSIGPSQSRLLPGDQGPRPRRLPGARPRAVVDRRGGRPRRRRVRDRGALPDPDDDPRRRRHGPGDGAGRADLPDAAPPRCELGADAAPTVGRPRVVRSLHLQPEELEEHNRHLQAKFADDRRARGPLGRRAARRRGDRDRRLRHRGAGRPDRDRARPRGRAAGRPVPADHAVAVPVRAAGRRGASGSGRSSSSSCRPARWSRTSGWRSAACARSSSTAGPAAWSRRRARSSTSFVGRGRRRVEPTGQPAPHGDDRTGREWS